MPKSCPLFLGLLVVGAATTLCLAQPPEESSVAPLPSVDLVVRSAGAEEDLGAEISDLVASNGNSRVPADGPVFTDHFIETVPPGPLVGNTAVGNTAEISDATIILGGAESIVLNEVVVKCPAAVLGDFRGYRYDQSFDYSWIPGGGDQLGMFSFGWNHYQERGINQGVDFGAHFNFLGGPDQTDMPPRVYDFSLSYQIRDRLGPMRLDLAASVLAASDFEGNSSEGILFPAHAVGFLDVHPTLDLVFGVDYLDRGDLKLLPVGGLIWTPSPEARFELVFPRPKIIFQLAESRHYLYLSGELGGGTWAIERDDLRDDLATYHELRFSIGVANQDGLAFEIGYLFDRHLEYSSRLGDMPLDDAVMARLTSRF